MTSKRKLYREDEKLFFLHSYYQSGMSIKRGRGAPWFASSGHGAYFIYDFGRNVLGCKQRFARKGR